MPTDVLCSTVEDLLHHHTSSHMANLHQARPHHPASDSALLDVKKNAAAAKQQCSQTSETTASSSNATDNSGLLKNARSASLPLKILLNDCIGDNNSCVANNTRRTNGGRFTVSDLSQKLIRSWNEGGDRVPLSPLDRRHREERGDVSSTSSTSSSRSSSNESTSSNSNARNANSNNNSSNQNTTTENFYLDDMDEEDDVDLDIDEDIDYEDEDEEDDEIEEESSGKTGSVDSSERTASSDAVVQFDLETEEDLQPTSATRIELPPAVLNCLGQQQQQPECLSDINNNDRNMKDNDEAVVEEDEAKEYDDVDEFDDDDKKQSVVSENEQSPDEAATSNNDLDQTITYEETPATSKEDQKLNNVAESLKNLDLEELEKDNKAVEVGEKTEYNATSSPVISSQIENDQHRSVSPINVVADDSSNHATNFNADETLNLEDDSEAVSVDTSSGYTSNNNSMTQSSSSSSSSSPGETPNTSSILSSETSSPSEPLSPSQSTATITQITVDMNKTPTTTTVAPKVVVEDNSGSSSRQQVNTSSASLSWSIGSSTSSMSSSAEDDAEENIFKNFMPKKSCLKKNYPNRHQLYIDTSNGGSGIFNSDNATSSPLVPATPTSPLSSSISSSPFFSSSSSSFQSPPSSSSHQSEMIRSKKRVSFADVCGKDLYTIRTMSEPSNCPPKLTSKIVQFFLNREFSNQQQNGNGFKSPYGASSKNSGVYGDGGDFFSRTRNYGYGISTSNYSNDLNQLAGTIAVYSLNFAQPSADYFKFRQRIVDSSVSLENVMLNRFQINGTIKVKNINFHKYVFIRCSFDKWSTHQDFAAQYVPSEYYSSMMSHNSHHHQQHFHQMLSSLSSSPSFSSSSSSASAYNSTPHHKEFDTFRFEFELPKNPSPSSPQSSTASSNSRSGSTPNASIQFCICYRAGDSGEFWDNNEGKNYEILQYVIDIESLKPQSAQRTITPSSSSPSLSDTKSRGASIYSNPSRPINDPITSDIYY